MNDRTKLLTLILSIAWLLFSGLSFYLGINLLQAEGLQKENIEMKQNENIELGTSENKPQENQSQNNPATIIEGNSNHERLQASTWFSDYEAVKKVAHLYDEIHPFIYSMKGGLHNTGELVSSWGKQGKTDRVKELRAINPKIKIIPTIFRWENPKEKISENIGMNGRSDIRDLHIQKILYEIDTYEYDGIDIDYEGMSCNKKEKFEEFIVLLSKEMKKRNKILSVAVHPKTSNPKEKMVGCSGLKNKVKLDFQENWRGPMTHDYAFLAKYVDKIKIMAYELHPRKYRNPGPGPQAPNVWISNIIEYASKRIPAHKLYMAIPTYGYDWALNCKAPAKAVYFSDANRIKSLTNKQFQPTDMTQIFENAQNSKSWKNLSKFMYIHENKIYEDPSLWYKSNGCDRVAFYMNRKAFEDKMTLLRKHNIAGFSFWQLISDNDPGINEYLELLITNKLPPILKEKISENGKEVSSLKQNKAKIEIAD